MLVFQTCDNAAAIAQYKEDEDNEACIAAAEAEAERAEVDPNDSSLTYFMKEGKKPVFQMSGLMPDQKEEMARFIEQLGKRAYKLFSHTHTHLYSRASHQRALSKFALASAVSVVGGSRGEKV